MFKFYFNPRIQLSLFVTSGAVFFFFLMRRLFGAALLFFAVGRFFVGFLRRPPRFFFLGAALFKAEMGMMHLAVTVFRLAMSCSCNCTIRTDETNY
jgi:hypothetical protein